MCTRYYLELSPELRPIIEEAKNSALARSMIKNLGKTFKSEGEIRPTDMVPVIAPDRSGKRKTFPMVWGFSVPGIRQPLVNARVESAKDKTSFRESWTRRRCVVPASYYYEWSHIQAGGKIRTGDKYTIQPADDNTTWFAGLYRIEEGYTGFRYPVFTILTREACPDLKRIHDRMPVMISSRDIDAWICPERIPKGIRPLTDMLAEKTQ
ncbi:MAG: SOS response-associated peptidase [Eubacterium sp.]|nr:SOS response-associated peptidase [Eubacterium sp.]